MEHPISRLDVSVRGGRESDKYVLLRPKMDGETALLPPPYNTGRGENDTPVGPTNISRDFSLSALLPTPPSSSEICA